MTLMKVNAVEPLGHAKLRILLSSGSSIEVDVSDYAKSPGYESLQKPTHFARVKVAEWGHGVEWPGDIAFPLDALNRLSREQSGRAWPTQDFVAWMNRHQLEPATVARELGLTKRKVLSYITGAKFIPIYIGLACEGWEQRRNA